MLEHRVCREGHHQMREATDRKIRCLFGPCGKTLVPRRTKNARGAGIESKPQSPVPSETTGGG